MSAKKNIVAVTTLIFLFLITGRETTISAQPIKVPDTMTKGITTFANAARAAELTSKDEYYLGRATAANIAGVYKIYRNTAMQTYLNMICKTIVINSPRPDIYNGYYVAILDTNEFNVFSTPGGHIFVTRGLIARAPNEDALAAVIAHAVAHIQLKHAIIDIRNARYANATITATLSGMGQAAGSEVEELAKQMGELTSEIMILQAERGFSKRHTFEADTMALSLLAAAGYRPQGLLEMLEILNQKSGSNARFNKSQASPAERIAEVNKHLKKYRVKDTSSYRKERFDNIIRQGA